MNYIKEVLASIDRQLEVLDVDRAGLIAIRKVVVAEHDKATKRSWGIDDAVVDAEAEAAEVPDPPVAEKPDGVFVVKTRLESDIVFPAGAELLAGSSGKVVVHALGSDDDAEHLVQEGDFICTTLSKTPVTVGVLRSAEAGTTVMSFLTENCPEEPILVGDGKVIVRDGLRRSVVDKSVLDEGWENNTVAAADADGHGDPVLDGDVSLDAEVEEEIAVATADGLDAGETDAVETADAAPDTANVPVDRKPIDLTPEYDVVFPAGAVIAVERMGDLHYRGLSAPRDSSLAMTAGTQVSHFPGDKYYVGIVRGRSTVGAVHLVECTEEPILVRVDSGVQIRRRGRGLSARLYVEEPDAVA